MAWWLWLVVGLACLGVEVMTPGTFVAVFFGAAALIVGILARFGWPGPAYAEWLLFSALSLVSVVVLRRPIRELLEPKPDAGAADSLIGQQATAVDAIVPEAHGRVELRGSSWQARNVGTAAIAAGQRCQVEKVDGLTLCVRA